MDFLEIFTSGSYNRDMKILKILSSNSKRVRVYGILKKWQIDDEIRGEDTKYNKFLDNLCLKQSLVLKTLLGMIFDSRNSKMTSKLP